MRLLNGFHIFGREILFQMHKKLFLKILKDVNFSKIIFLGSQKSVNFEKKN